MTRDLEIESFFAAVRALVAPAIEAAGDVAPALRTVLRELDGAPLAHGLAAHDPTPGRKPGCRHLARALALTERAKGPVAGLAAAFAALEPRLAWIQNPNYTAENVGADYLANNTYVNVVGPRGLVASPRLALGFWLIGPGLSYPDHNHEAEEIYFPISGDGLWRQGDGPWEAKPAGSAIRHPPWLVHAMKSGRQPMFAFYCWRGALNQPARLTG